MPITMTRLWSHSDDVMLYQLPFFLCAHGRWCSLPMITLLSCVRIRRNTLFFAGRWRGVCIIGLGLFVFGLSSTTPMLPRVDALLRYLCFSHSGPSSHHSPYIIVAIAVLSYFSVLYPLPSVEFRLPSPVSSQQVCHPL